MANERILYLIAKIGGWDGISFQNRLWVKLLVSIKKKVTVATGEIDESTGPINVYPYNRTKRVVIKEMGIGAQEWLFKNSFKDKYDRKEWVKRFVKTKEAIKKDLEVHCNENDVIMAHNFSIKHIVPAAWAAFHEMADEHPDKKFISIDADSPYERGFVIGDIHPDVIWIIGNPDIWQDKSVKEIEEALAGLKGRKIHALPGPEPLENVFHISFNNYQSRVIKDIYGINPDNLTIIPDMGEFNGLKKGNGINTQRLLKLLSSGQVVNPRKKITRKDVFFISPVRPIYRKNIRYIAYLANQYSRYLKETDKERNVNYVITHPIDARMDSLKYWNDAKREIGSMDITLIDMSDHLVLRRKDKIGVLYEEFLHAISKMHSISVIGSTSGAWENGIVESTESKIPVSVNPLLPAYQDMIMMGFMYIPAQITRAALMLEKGLGDYVWMNDPSIERYFETITQVLFNKRKRKRIVEHNFRVGKENLSLEVVRPVIEKILIKGVY